MKYYIRIQWGMGYGIVPLSGRWLGGIIYLRGKIWIENVPVFI
jgi:hypothetical protein